MTSPMATFESALAAVDADRTIELATQFCSIPSPPGEEAELAEFIANILDRPGTDVHIEDVVEGRPNVVARIAGAGTAPPLVLNGHIDATAYPTGWSRDPYDPWRDGKRLYGGAITDMQGALAAMVAAVEAAPSAGTLPGDLILHAVMHHDTIGAGTKILLMGEGPTEGFGICGEPSDLAISTANGGAIKWQIRLRGSGGHISRKEDGVDALKAANALYSAVADLEFVHEPCDRLPDLPRSLVGIVRGGFASGAIAEEAFVEGDVRTVPGMTRESVLQQLRAVASEVCDERVEVRVRSTAVQRHFFGATEGVLIEALSEAHAGAMGHRPRISNELPTQVFVTDAADMAAVGLETVVYGVGSWHYAPDEWINVDDLVGSARAYLATAAQIGDTQ
jgi:acetylornithine deacetylase